MTCTLPDVTLKGIHLRWMFAEFVDHSADLLSNDADAFIATFELEGQVTAEQLVADYRRDA